jgi:hypothetical protein
MHLRKFLMPTPPIIAVKLVGLALYIRESRVQTSVWRCDPLTECVHGFPQSLHTCTHKHTNTRVEMIDVIKWLPLPYKYFPFQYLLIIRLLDCAVQA